MDYISKYASPMGILTLVADEIGLKELRFPDYEIEGESVTKGCGLAEEALDKAKEWLNQYFQGKTPEILVPMHLVGTAFQLEVWEQLLEIAYGHTVSYGEIAKKIACKRGIPKMSAQAVGGAVGRNPIPIIIPCHRVIGTDGSLTGYSAGMNRKIELLKIESSGTFLLSRDRGDFTFLKTGDTPRDKRNVPKIRRNLMMKFACKYHTTLLQ